MAQVVKAEVLNPRFCQRVVPSRVGHVRPQGCVFVRNATSQVLFYLLFETDQVDNSQGRDSDFPVIPTEVSLLRQPPPSA